MSLNPDLAAAAAALAEGRAGDVSDPLRRAASIEIGDDAHWTGVISAAAQIGDDDVALVAAARFLSLAPHDAGRRAVEMQLLAETGATREALAVAQQLVADYPADSRWPLLAGTYLARLGLQGEALQSLRASARLAPDSALMWETLANLKTFRAGDPDLAMLELAVSGAKQPAQAAALNYALGKAYDDLGDVDRAFTCFQRGAGMMVGGRSPRMNAFFLQAEQARAAFPSSRLTTGHMTDRTERPILVVGCPRSGTTLLERILASSPAVVSGGELKFLRLACLGFSPPSPASVDAFTRRAGSEIAAWDQVAAGYVDRLTRRFKHADGVIDKGPVNYLYLGALALALPRTRIIHVRRDPMDVAWSCFRRRFNQGLVWTYSFESIAAFIRVYEDMMQHWKSVLGDRIITVEFERLVADPDTETARLFDFLGIERPGDWQSFHEKPGEVLTASQTQVRRPLNAEGVGAWRRYERHLEPLVQALTTFGVLPHGDTSRSTEVAP